MLDVGVLHALVQLRDFILPLLLQLHLGVGGSASLVQPVSKVFNLPGKVRSLPLGLGTRLTFSFKFFFAGAFSCVHEIKRLVR